MAQPHGPDYHEKLPGLRDYSGADANHGVHGIDEILDVIHQLSAAGIPFCVVGVSALRYYGAARVTDEWDFCVPDDKLATACQLLLDAQHDGNEKYKIDKPPPPVPPSVRHTFPSFRRKCYNFWFILTPSSDCFVDPSLEAHVERSKNGVPYASLIQFARSLLIQQRGSDRADFIDGMNLDIEWGQASDEFVKLKNHRLKDDGYSGGLSPQPLEDRWREIASSEAKQRRIEPLKQGRYFTRWRIIKSPKDPRTKDRPV
ncbi:hypothetical protein N658DRAFT_507453 [Parathielavia hyrcaniae]|uniref:Uncharacterized protein n=1 Tax=Parathielavia hyrcaniae TaxID=113614 RepID=A0AAN6PZL7_9PEZI|nr:hypothetical protein N658DRAFT_507453 [Parathielavia hyrcaniae]